MVNFRPLATFVNPQPVGPGALIPLLPGAGAGAGAGAAADAADAPPLPLPNLGEIAGMLQAGKDAPPPLPQPPADVGLQADEELGWSDVGMGGGGRKRRTR